MTHKFKLFCFFCNYIMKKGSKHRTLTFKNRLIKVCMTCSSEKHEVLKKQYKNCKVDCSVCCKKVMYKNCNLCDNCDHFVHNTCADLCKKDVALIEKFNKNWYCPTCVESIFPFSSNILTDKTCNKLIKSKSSTGILARQCFLCTGIISSTLYPNKKAIYNNQEIDLCINCSKTDNLTTLVKDKTLIELLDCPACEKNVLYESIFCSICLHWAHPSCHNLELRDLKNMSGDDYGDWICTKCLKEALPFTAESIEHEDVHTSKNVKTDKLLTYDDCSVCYTKVKSNSSLCCTLCRNWVHRRCIGTFKTTTQTNEFSSFLSYYKDKDWFCPVCTADIFPFLKLTDNEYDITMLETSFGLRMTSENLQTFCKTVSDINMFNNSYSQLHSTNNPGNDLSDVNETYSNTTTIKSSKYIFGLSDIKYTTSRKNCTFLNFNIRSIRQNFHKFCGCLSNSSIRIDIIILTETWLNNEANIKDFAIDGYHTPMVQNRDNKNGGGVLVYLSERFEKFHIRKDLCFKDEFNHCLTIEYTINNQKNFVTACYRSPADNKIDVFIGKLEAVLRKCKYKSTVAGDMNLNIVNYERHRETNDYYNMFTSNGYKPVITNPTRITNETATLIDHIWTNNIESKSSLSYILVTDITDHLPCIYIDNDLSNEESVKYTTYRQMTETNRKIFTDSVKHSEDALAFHTVNSSTSTQTKYCDYFDHLGRLYETAFPIKKKKVDQKHKNKPWIDAELDKLMKKKNKLFSKKRNGNPSVIQKFKGAKKELSLRMQEAERAYYHKKLYNDTSTLKQRWDSLRTLINRCKKSTDFCPVDSKQLGEHYSTIARRLNNKMTNIKYDDIPHCSHEQKPYQTNSKIKHLINSQFTFTEFNKHEIYEAILKLDINKGPGLDDLDVKSIKSIANIISPHLCILYNLSLRDSVYPDIFKKAKCVPIFKGNQLDPYLPANYRPISILNCLNKTLERLIHDQMYTYIEANEILPEFQFGYRKKRSTSQAVLRLCDIIEMNKLNNRVSIAIFMDLSKAFDTVDKDILCSKLDSIGFCTKSNNLIYDYMSNRSMCLKKDLTKCYPLEYGVPQGSILGPLLFLTYIHDMDTFCKNVKKLVYADDTTVIISGRSIREAKEHANDILEQFYNYFTVNKLTINESKTKYMILDFRTKLQKMRDIDATQLTMNNVILEKITKIRFLGVIINNTLTWEDHKMYLKNNINKALGIIYNCRNILKHSHLINIYKCFIQPYFNYCITVWGSSIRSKTDTITVLQNRIMRIIFSCKRTEDAWNCNTDQKILTIKQLYHFEIAKLCFNHHCKYLPTSMNSAMPDFYDPDYDRVTKSMTAHNYKHSSKNNKTLSHNCISTWNSLPSGIKNIAYIQPTYIRRFADAAKNLVAQDY